MDIVQLSSELFDKNEAMSLEKRGIVIENDCDLNYD